MIAPAWLARLLPITANSKVKVTDPITGEEAVIISKRLLCDKLAEAYQSGAEDQYAGNANKHSQDDYVKGVTEELNL